MIKKQLLKLFKRRDDRPAISAAEVVAPVETDRNEAILQEWIELPDAGQFMIDLNPGAAFTLTLDFNYVNEVYKPVSLVFGMRTDQETFQKKVIMIGFDPLSGIFINDFKSNRQVVKEELRATNLELVIHVSPLENDTSYASVILAGAEARTLDILKTKIYTTADWMGEFGLSRVFEPNSDTDNANVHFNALRYQGIKSVTSTHEL